MMLTDDDWSSLPAGARGAILAWIRLGGRLVVYATSTSSTLASLGIGDGEAAQLRPGGNAADSTSSPSTPRRPSTWPPRPAGSVRGSRRSTRHGRRPGRCRQLFGSRAFNYLSVHPGAGRLRRDRRSDQPVRLRPLRQAPPVVRHHPADLPRRQRAAGGADPPAGRIRRTRLPARPGRGARRRRRTCRLRPPGADLAHRRAARQPLRSRRGRADRRPGPAGAESLGPGHPVEWRRRRALHHPTGRQRRHGLRRLVPKPLRAGPGPDLGDPDPRPDRATPPARPAAADARRSSSRSANCSCSPRTAASGPPATSNPAAR